MIIQAIVNVTSSDEKEFDLDFACELIYAPIFAIIIIMFATHTGFSNSVFWSQAYSNKKMG